MPLLDRLTESDIITRAAARPQRSPLANTAWSLLWAAIAGIMLAVLVVLAFSIGQPAYAKWDGQRFTCPAGTDVWADEQAAVAGKPYVYCVKAQTKP